MKFNTAHHEYTVSERKVEENLWDVRMTDTSDGALLDSLGADKSLGAVRKLEGGGYTVMSFTDSPLFARSKRTAFDLLITIAQNKMKREREAKGLLSPRANFQSIKINEARTISEQVAKLTTLCLGDVKSLAPAEIVYLNEAIERMQRDAEMISLTVAAAKARFTASL